MRGPWESAVLWLPGHIYAASPRTTLWEAKASYTLLTSRVNFFGQTKSHTLQCWLITNGGPINWKLWIYMQNSHILLKVLHISVLEKCKLFVIPKSCRFSVLKTLVHDLWVSPKLQKLKKFFFLFINSFLTWGWLTWAFCRDLVW